MDLKLRQNQKKLIRKNKKLNLTPHQEECVQIIDPILQDVYHISTPLTATLIASFVPFVPGLNQLIIPPHRWCRLAAHHDWMIIGTQPSSNPPQIQVYDLTTGQCLYTFLHHPGEEITSCFVTMDHCYLVVGTQKHITVWNITSNGTRTHTFGTGYSVFLCGITAQQQCVIVRMVNKDQYDRQRGQIEVYDIATGSLQRTIRTESVWDDILMTEYSAVIAVKTGDDGLYNDGSIIIFDITTGQERCTIPEGHETLAGNTEFLMTKCNLGKKWWDYQICVWSVMTGECVHTWKMNLWHSCAGYLTSDHQYLILGFSHQIEIRSLTSGKLLHTIWSLKEAIGTFCVSGTYHFIIVACENNTVSIYDPETGQLVEKIKRPRKKQQKT